MYSCMCSNATLHMVFQFMGGRSVKVSPFLLPLLSRCCCCCGYRQFRRRHRGNSNNSSSSSRVAGAAPEVHCRSRRGWRLEQETPAPTTTATTTAAALSGRGGVSLLPGSRREGDLDLLALPQGRDAAPARCPAVRLS